MSYETSFGICYRWRRTAIFGYRNYQKFVFSVYDNIPNDVSHNLRVFIDFDSSRRTRCSLAYWNSVCGQCFFAEWYTATMELHQNVKIDAFCAGRKFNFPLLNIFWVISNIHTVCTFNVIMNSENYFRLNIIALEIYVVEVWYCQDKGKTVEPPLDITVLHSIHLFVNIEISLKILDDFHIILNAREGDCFFLRVIIRALHLLRTPPINT